MSIGKSLAQRMHVGPVVVQGDAAGIGMAVGFQAEPILDLALLPVDGRDFGGDGRKRRLARRRWECAAAGTPFLRVFEDVVDVEADSSAMRSSANTARVAAARRAKVGRGRADIGERADPDRSPPDRISSRQCREFARWRPVFGRTSWLSPPDLP